jgi:hypothetical protein
MRQKEDFNEAVVGARRAKHQQWRNEKATRPPAFADNFLNWLSINQNLEV